MSNVSRAMREMNQGYSLEGHTEGASRRLDAPLHRLDFSEELSQLRKGPWATDGHGHHAKTLVKHDDFRVVLVSLDAGARMDAHRAPGSLAVQTLSGHVRIGVGGARVDLPAGGLLSLEREVTHDVEALEDSAVLLTLSWPRGK